jgi:spermidine synthase
LTVVEIDPVVFDFAHRYFAVPDTMGGAVIEDARVFLRRERTEVSPIPPPRVGELVN